MYSSICDKYHLIICQVIQDAIQTDDNLWSESTDTRSLKLISVPGAEGFVFAPVKAFIDTKLWHILPLEFLDSAIVNNRQTELLLEDIDTEHSIKTTTVTDYNLQSVRHHPILPLTSAARKLKDNLHPLLFNILIDCYEVYVQDMFELNVCY